MSLILDGGSDCKICLEILHVEDDRISFGPLVDHNASTSPLRFFSQQTFHMKCVADLPIGVVAIEKQHELDQVPRRPLCALCGLRIEAPENLSINELVRFYEYESVTVPRDAAIPAMLPALRNGQHFHRTCLVNSGRFAELVASVEHLMAKGYDPFAVRHWLRALDPQGTQIEWLRRAHAIDQLLKGSPLDVAREMSCPRCGESALKLKFWIFDEPISSVPLLRQNLYFLQAICVQCNMWVAGVQYLTKDCIPSWVSHMDQ